METDADWYVACSDDENYGFTKNEVTGDWEPSIEDIKELYGILGKGKKLELEWKCPGRRAPTPENKEENVSPMKTEETNKEDDKHDVTEFDFDDIGAEENPITPRRTPASTKTPRSNKRVARLDKIMDDIFRHKKINQNEKLNRSSVGGQSPARLNDSSSNTPSRLSPRASPRASPRGSPKPSHSASETSTKGVSSPKGNTSPKKL